MKLKDLLGKDILSELATPSNLKLGEEIFKSGRVEVLSLDESITAAKVSGGQKRRTEIQAEDDGLKWKCSCLGKRSHIFCKHCVALAMTIKEMNIVNSNEHLLE